MKDCSWLQVLVLDLQDILANVVVNSVTDYNLFTYFSMDEENKFHCNLKQEDRAINLPANFFFILYFEPDSLTTPVKLGNFRSQTLLTDLLKFGFPLNSDEPQVFYMDHCHSRLFPLGKFFVTMNYIYLIL